MANEILSSDPQVRLRAGLERQDHASDVVLMGDFTAWYCRAHHRDRVRKPLKLLSHEMTNTSQRRLPQVCDECAEYLRYAQKRTAYCAHDPKPFCTNCSESCYNDTWRAYARKVMRYSGPRSLVSRHGFIAARHILGFLHERATQ